MALEYVKEDLFSFISQRNFDKLPDGFYWVMFPYRGRQPPPFPKEYTDESSDYDEEGPAVSEERVLPFTNQGRDKGYLNEIRWWFYPLVFIDDLPFDEKYRDIIASTAFLIGPLAGRNLDLGRVAKVNPNGVAQISKNYEITRDGEKFLPPIEEVAGTERFRVSVEVKEKAKVLKKTYPELFGETTDSGSGGMMTLYEKETSRETSQGKTKFSAKVKAKLKKLSPTLSKKAEKSS